MKFMYCGSYGKNVGKWKAVLDPVRIGEREHGFFLLNKLNGTPIQSPTSIGGE